MQIGDTVPIAGELIMDTTSNKLKIGDGKTAIKDLPWVDIGLDLAKEETRLSVGTKAFLEDHIDLIENNDYDTLYSRIATPALAQEVTRALLKAGLNPKPYLSKIPQSIRHILEPNSVWVEDTGRMYTKAELDSMMQYSDNDLRLIDEWNKKLFNQMGIPQNMIKVGN
jgi:hypothetical protein